MQQIYQGLCGLEISFRCALPASILKALAVAKEAGGGKVSIGESELLIAPTGAKGYAYRFDADMASWLVSHSNNPELWNTRGAVRIDMLRISKFPFWNSALNGLAFRAFSFESAATY